MMEHDFLDFFQQEVTIKPWTGQNVYAEATYGPGVDYPARVQQKVKMIRNAQGQEVISTVQVYLDGTAPVTVKDLIILPDDTQPLIQAVTSSPDETGVIHHKVVWT